MKQNSDETATIVAAGAVADYRAALGRAHELVAEARQRTAALAHQLALARNMLADSKELLGRTTKVFAVPFHVAPERLSEAPLPQPSPSGVRTFAAVAELIERVEEVARDKPDVIGQLIADLKIAIESETDPCMLMGFCMEGILQVLARQVPPEARRSTVLAMAALLFDRANAADDRG